MTRPYQVDPNGRGWWRLPSSSSNDNPSERPRLREPNEQDSSEPLEEKSTSDLILNDCFNAVLNIVPKNFLKHAKVVIPLLAREAINFDYTESMLAYLLATAEHESRFGAPDKDGLSGMYEKWGPTAVQKTYEPKFDVKGNVTNKKAIQLGNTNKGDGYLFRGRGYIQITGRGNYDDWSQMYNKGKRYVGNGVYFDTWQFNPENAVTPAVAAHIAAKGLKNDLFVKAGRDLKNTIKSGTRAEFEKARSFVNGTDKKEKIAQRALDYQTIMKSEDCR